MCRWVPELLHTDALNAPKLFHKWCVMAHATPYGRSCCAAFYAKLGKPIDLRKKQNGRVKADAWFKGSDWDELVEGSNRIPGGVSAWFPCFVLLIADCQAETRAGGGDRATVPTTEAPKTTRPTPSTGYAVRHDSSDEEDEFYECEEGAGEEAAAAAPRPDLLTLLTEIYGLVLAQAMLVMVRGMDAYVAWRKTIREPCASAPSAESKQLALRSACAAVKFASYFEDGSNGQAHGSSTS